MRIANIRISGFRSISYTATPSFKDDGNVDTVTWQPNSFSFEMRVDSQGQDITGLVGPNSSGKSNVLRALRLFFSVFDSEEKDKPDKYVDFHKYDPDAQTEGANEDIFIIVEVHFDALNAEEFDALKGYCKLDPDSEGEITPLVVGIVWNLSGEPNVYCRREQDQVTVTYLGSTRTHANVGRIANRMPRFYWLPTGEDVTKELQMRGGKYLKKLIDNVLEEIKQLEAKPEADLSDTERVFTGQVAKAKNHLDGLKSELDVLRELPSPLNELAEKLVNYMQPIMARVEAWFEYSSNLPSHFWGWLDVTTMRFDDGWPSSISEKGHGVQRTFALALLQAYADFRMRKGGEHPFLIAVEEPEIYMHPHVVRVVANTLFELSRDGQVIFTSHSPILVQPLGWENLILIRTEAEASVPRQITKDSLSLADKDKIRRNLDAAECEMFFANGVILVEGPTERFALPGMIRTLKKSDHSISRDLDELGVSVIDVGGCENFLPFVKLLRAFGIKWTILADNDALGRLISQLYQCGIITEVEHQELNGLHNFEDKRLRLRDFNCCILPKDFEEVIAGALPSEQLWGIINEARTRQGKAVLPPCDPPGDTECKVEWLVDQWVGQAWKDVVRKDISPEYHSQYQPLVNELFGKLKPEAAQIAETIIGENHWITNTRDKWYANQLAQQGKPTIGMVIGDYLSKDEILQIDEFKEVISYLNELQKNLTTRESK